MKVFKNFCNKYLVLIPCTFIVFLNSQAFSQEKDKDSISRSSDSLKTFTLRDVEVKSSEYRKIHSSPVAVQQLKGTDLENLNSLSIADAVRYFSGVQLKDYGGIGGLKTINVRNLGSQHTSVYYDGLAIGNAQNGQIDLGKYSLQNMKEISLYSGQKPDLLQPAKAHASASSLYLISETPEFKDGKRHHTNVQLKGGSFGLLNPSLNASYKIIDNIYTKISSEYLHANGRYKFRYTNGVYDTTATRNNTDITSLRLETGIYKTQDKGISWSINFYHYQSNRGLPGAIVANRFDYSQRLWDRNSFMQGSYKNKLNKRYSFAIKGKFAKDYTRYLDPEHISLDGFLDNRYDQKEGYLSLANEFIVTNYWKIGLSTDFQYNKLDANLYRFAYPVRKTVLAALTSDIELDNIHIQGSLLGTIVNETVKTFNDTSNKEELSPTLMFNWKPFKSETFRVRGFYKNIFRLPTFNDLYYTFIGNTNLKPEYTNQYNLGFSFSKILQNGFLNHISIQSDLYYNTVKDKIIAMPSANLFRWTMMNLGKVDIRGLELALQTQHHLTKNLTLSTRTNYTYQKAIDLTPKGTTYSEQIPYAPLHSGSFISTIAANTYGMNYSFIYTGERYSQKANIPANYVEPWYTHDIAFWRTFEISQQKVKLHAEVNNFLNQYYDVILNFPMPGRHYRLTLTVPI